MQQMCHINCGMHYSLLSENVFSHFQNTSVMTAISAHALKLNNYLSFVFVVIATFSVGQVAVRHKKPFVTFIVLLTIILFLLLPLEQHTIPGLKRDCQALLKYWPLVATVANAIM